ncbi:MAG: prepilin-type N-terminal cleavage/methylation domain-containing protein [Verrucomicrobiota bacterium]
MTSFLSEKTGSRARTISETGRPFPRDKSATGFSLVELVIAIAVVTILTGITIPAIDSAQRAHLAREPVNALHGLAREVRLRAMTEQRPYQIVFDSEGFRASRFFQPYGGPEEFETLRLELEQLDLRDEMIEASMARGINLSEVDPDPRQEMVEDGIRYLEEYELDPEVTCRLRSWSDTDWVELRGGVYRKWVFQPSGMCDPMKFQVEADGSFFELEFHPLTADVKRERSWVE